MPRLFVLACAIAAVPVLAEEPVAVVSAQAGAIFKAPETGSLPLRLPGDGIMEVEPGSVVELGTKGGGELILKSGVARAWIGRRGRLSVRAGAAKAEVNGRCVFQVLLDGSGASAWDVVDGALTVRAGGGKTALKAGNHVNVDSRGLLSPNELSAPGLELSTAAPAGR